MADTGRTLMSLRYHKTTLKGNGRVPSYRRFDSDCKQPVPVSKKNTSIFSYFLHWITIIVGNVLFISEAWRTLNNIV